MQVFQRFPVQADARTLNINQPVSPSEPWDFTLTPYCCDIVPSSGLVPRRLRTSPCDRPLHTTQAFSEKKVVRFCYSKTIFETMLDTPSLSKLVGWLNNKSCLPHILKPVFLNIFHSPSSWFLSVQTQLSETPNHFDKCSTFTRLSLPKC